MAEGPELLLLLLPGWGHLPGRGCMCGDVGGGAADVAGGSSFAIVPVLADIHVGSHFGM